MNELRLALYVGSATVSLIGTALGIFWRVSMWHNTVNSRLDKLCLNFEEMKEERSELRAKIDRDHDELTALLARSNIQ